MKKTEVPAGMTLVKTSSLNAMADNIQAIAESVKALSGDGRLTEDALITLIERNCPPTTYSQGPVTRTHIKKVLESMRTLDRFVQKKKAS